MARLTLDANHHQAFWVGLCASFAAGIFIDCAKRIGLDAGIATSLVMAVASSALWIVYPEKVKLSLLSIGLVIIGGLLGVAYSNFGLNEDSVRITATNPVDIIIYMLNIVIIIPLFEELCVRRLMFLGGTRLLGPYLSAAFVSLLFAWTHGGMFMFAFLISILLCAATYRGVDTLNRSIFHGSYNLVLAVHLLHMAM